MNETIDNSQEKTLKTKIQDICWLAGAFDADGTVTIRDAKARSPHPYFDLSNSDDVFIEKTVRVLKSLGVNPHIREQKLNKKWKTVYRVSLGRQAQVKQVLEILLPYLTAKKARASLVIDYIDNHNYEIVKDVKLLNRRGDVCSSETTRENPLP